MRRFITALALLMLPTLAAAQPQIKMEPEHLEFGALSQHETRDARVTITNTGDQLLRIRDIESTCGCTVPELDTRELAPGAATVMDVHFNSKGFQGPQIKYIHVFSNDPHRGAIDLLITADVKVPLQMTPRQTMVRFPTVKIGESNTQTYTFRSEEVDELEITARHWPKEWLDIVIKPGPDPQTVGVDFTVRKDSPAGRHRDPIKLATNVPSMPLVSLEADIKLVTDLVLGMERVNLRVVRPGQALKSRIRVAPYRPGTEFKLLRAEIDIPGLNARVENGPKESFALINGTALAADHPVSVETNGRIQGTLRIFTDLGSTPEIEIPVTYMLRR